MKDKLKTILIILITFIGFNAIIVLNLVIRYVLPVMIGFFIFWYIIKHWPHISGL